MKKAFITGVAGQDGSYLVEFLLNKGYEVHGLIRRSSLEQKLRIDHLYKDPHVPGNMFKVHYGDITDSSNINNLIKKIEPDEIYNLAAQSHVKVSFDMPDYTANVDGLGAMRILEAIRLFNLAKYTKYYQASTSELFGATSILPQNEKTPFYPRSPYGVAKLYAYWITVNYREAYSIFASNGILFNHESPRRGSSFVSKKIAIAAAQICKGIRSKLYLGNLYAKRDWGFAKDYVESMWLILQHSQPDDFVIATNESHSVKEFVEFAFYRVGIDLIWEGHGINEKGIDKKNGNTIIEIDPWYFRPTEVDILQGNYEKANRILNWRPKVTFNELVNIMVDYELEQIK